MKSIKDSMIELISLWLFATVVIYTHGCAGIYTDPLFGLSANAPHNEVAVVNVSDLYSGLSNGVWIDSDPPSKEEFTTKPLILLPPGKYNIRVRSLTHNVEAQVEGLRVIAPRYYDVQLDVQAGKRYRLLRIQTQSPRLDFQEGKSLSLRHEKSERIDVQDVTDAEEAIDEISLNAENEGKVVDSSKDKEASEFEVSPPQMLIFNTAVGKSFTRTLKITDHEYTPNAQISSEVDSVATENGTNVKLLRKTTESGNTHIIRIEIIAPAFNDDSRAFKDYIIVRMKDTRELKVPLIMAYARSG